jgi:hypothetical protein
VLYDEVAPAAAAAEDGGGLAECRGADADKRTNAMDSGESLCCQWLALEAFPDAQYVCSAWHAGQGQVTFGSNYRRKADCLLAVDLGDGRRTLAFFNYHGLAFHGDGRHLPSCRFRERADATAAAAAATAEVERTLGSGGGSSGSVAGSLERTLGPDHPATLRQVDRAATLRSTRRGGPTWAGADAARGQDDAAEDALRLAYAEALTAVDPGALAVSYQVVHECQLLHGETAPDPGLWNPTTAADRGDRHARHKTVRDLLETEHPVDSCLGAGRLKRFATQEQFVERVLAEGFSSEQDGGGDALGGFVTLTGGRETREGDGVLPGSFAFCHQRCPVPRRQLGEFASLQAREDVRHGRCVGSHRRRRDDDDDDDDEDDERPRADNKRARREEERLERAGEAELDALADGAAEGTMTRTSFHERGETLTLDYFRFLVRERGLAGYRIRHYVFYRHKPYLTPFVVDMLQRRHDLRGDPGSGLMRNLLKLVLNGLYGYCSVQSSSFPRTRVVSESYLAKLGRNNRLGLHHRDVYEVTLLGVARRRRRTKMAMARRRRGGGRRRRRRRKRKRKRKSRPPTCCTPSPRTDPGRRRSTFSSSRPPSWDSRATSFWARS